MIQGLHRTVGFWILWLSFKVFLLMPFEFLILEMISVCFTNTLLEILYLLKYFCGGLGVPESFTWKHFHGGLRMKFYVLVVEILDMGSA